MIPRLTVRVVFCIVAAFVLAAGPLLAVIAARDGTSLVIQSGKTRIRVPKQFDEYAFFVTIHAAAKRNGKFHVVYGTSVLTRGFPPRSGACGCGIETYIQWIEVSEKGEIVNAHRGLYESCATNREGRLLGWDGGELRWVTTDLVEGERNADGTAIWRNITFSYDSARPNEGISEHVESN